MADVSRLKGVVREEFGKGASRRARRAGLVPAVIYSAGMDPVHVDLPGHEVFLIVKDNANALVEVVFESDSQLALVKDVQRHPVRRDILHVDLLAVKRGEKVDVEVPLTLTGESAPETVVNQEYFTILVQAPATKIPESVEISVEGLEEGSTVTVEQLKLPADVTCELDAETILASIVIPEEVPEPEPTEGEEAEEGEAGAEEGEASQETEA